jgi:tetratricopeptide (TPR) repeat protein
MEAVGGVMWWQADLAAMKPAYAEALELWRQIGDKAEIANALYNYAFAFSVGPDPTQDPTRADPDGEGFRAMEEALALYREVGNRRGEANVLWGMGNAGYFLNQGDAGASYFRQALEIFHAEGDVTMEAWSLHMLGSALLRQGRADESRPLLRDALGRFRDAGDASGIAMVLDDLGSQAVADGDLPRAARLRGAARRLSSETGTMLAMYVDDQFETFFRPGVKGKLDDAERLRYEQQGESLALDDVVVHALGGPFLAPEETDQPA